MLPIRGHLAWKFVSVIYCQACPMHTHTGNDGVSRLTNYRALHIWPPPLLCVRYRISQGVHPDIPPQSSFQLLPFWISCLFLSFFPKILPALTPGVILFSLLLHAGLSFVPSLAWGSNKYLIILLIRIVNFITVVEGRTSKTSAKIFSFCL